MWSPSEENALKNLKNLSKPKFRIMQKRNFPNIIGTSKLSPFIKFGQIHVETVWSECVKIKISTSKYLAEIG